jgi:uncharacterized protein (DUF2132 family)
MSQEQPKNLLHGITLKDLLEDLVARHGWEVLADAIRIDCFRNEPSIKSSLKFLRRTDWARAKVEAFYAKDLRRMTRNRQRKAQRQRTRTRAELASTQD